jgi:signal transduction histidine kinase
MNLVEGLANRKQIQTAITIQPGLHVVQADGRRLKQILVNLLSNAVKFTPDGGRVGLEVTAERDTAERDKANRDTVQFVVWDTGIGISDDDLPRLFQSFVQLDSSLARRHAGTGLGLALVKRLVELHGGKVLVQSRPGQGSRFTIQLPMGQSAPISER